MSYQILNKEVKKVIIVAIEIWNTKNKQVRHEIIWIRGKKLFFENFKNFSMMTKFSILSMPVLSPKHNVKFSWNFSATSHGKEPIDGTGATRKQ